MILQNSSRRVVGSDLIIILLQIFCQLCFYLKDFINNIRQLLVGVSTNGLKHEWAKIPMERTSMVHERMTFVKHLDRVTTNGF